jgi:hypothetical protein
MWVFLQATVFRNWQEDRHVSLWARMGVPLCTMPIVQESKDDECLEYAHRAGYWHRSPMEMTISQSNGL